MRRNRNRPLSFLHTTTFSRFRMRNLKQRRTPPSIYNPVRGFEVLLAAESAERDEVLRLQEEGVGELVAVDEEG